MRYNSTRLQATTIHRYSLQEPCGKKVLEQIPKPANQKTEQQHERNLRSLITQTSYFSNTPT